MAEVVEPSRHKALNSIPPKKKKKPKAKSVQGVPHTVASTNA
jgi:hypothetical protein